MQRGATSCQRTPGTPTSKGAEQDLIVSGLGSEAPDEPLIDHHSSPHHIQVLQAYTGFEDPHTSPCKHIAGPEPLIMHSKANTARLAKDEPCHVQPCHAMRLHLRGESC